MVDTLLAERAQDVLARHPHLFRNRRIQLEAMEGKLTLRGKVASYFQKQMAQEALRSVQGVAGIQNLLEVECC